MTKKYSQKNHLINLFSSGLKAVNGQLAVENQLLISPIKGRVAVLAVGKAASAMMLGAQKQLNDQIHSALVITKTGFVDKSLRCESFTSGHPIPTIESLEAGKMAVDFISNIPKDTQFLALVSGGASALLEVLPQNIDLSLLRKVNQWLIASGLEIADMNRIRQSISLIKAGKVLRHFQQVKMTQFLISDVKDDDLKIIGSGLFIEGGNNYSMPTVPGWLLPYLNINRKRLSINVEVDSHIVASNELACEAIISEAKKNQQNVIYHGQTLYGDVFELSKKLAAELITAKSGIHIWGGEPTLQLPSETGVGGRNQSLALALACEIDNVDGITILVGATDGNDGPTNDAGAVIDGRTIDKGKALGDARDYLNAADAGSYLAEAGDLLSTGATGTNVMDIVIALKE